MGWFRRFTNNLRSNRLSSDIRREMEFHMAERTDDLVAQGMDAAAARNEARRRFGNPTVQRERTRDADLLTWLESLGADVRYAFRALRKTPGFALIAVLSLGLGIGANTAIFSLIDAVILKTLPVTRPEELVQVTLGGELGSFTNPIWEQVRDHHGVFTGVFAYGGETYNLATGGEVRRAVGSIVSGDYFSTLGVRPAAGRLLARTDDARGCPPVAVLGHGFWQSEYGGSPSVIGTQITLNGRPHAVVGVTEPRFFGVEVGRSVQVYTPLCLQDDLDNRSTWYLSVIGRVKPGITAEMVSARMAAISPALFASTIPDDWPPSAKAEYVKKTLSAAPAGGGLSELRREYKAALFVLMGVVGIVLLIACANVANLLLARAAVRRREMAIRLAIGAARRRLVRQLLTESVLLATLGAIAGVLFARWGAMVLVRVLSQQRSDLSLDLALDARVLAFTLGVAVVTGILFGLAPAWQAARVDPQAALKANPRGVAEGHSRFTIGKSLVVGQIALSLVLVIGAGLLLTSFRRLLTLDPGFRTDGVLIVSTNVANAGYSDSARAGVRRELLERFRRIPGVQSASMSELTPVSGSAWNGPIDVDGFVHKTRGDDLVFFNAASDGYFATLGTPLLAGRDFDARDTPQSGKVAMINETLARRFFGTTNPVGKAFYEKHGDVRGDRVEIIGVVKDTKYQSLRHEVPPTAFLALDRIAAPGPYTEYTIRVAGDTRSIIPAVKTASAEVNRAISLQMTTFTRQVDASLTRDRLLATLSAFFGGLALLLAIVGLYGTLAYSVARRRNEIGIRIALGAERSRVVRLVLGEVTRLVLVGLVLGGLAAVGALRWVSAFLYDLSASDPTTLAAATLTLASVALLAGAIPAWRASRVDPVESLREE